MGGVYRLLPRSKRAYFGKSIVIQIGGVWPLAMLFTCIVVKGQCAFPEQWLDERAGCITKRDLLNFLFSPIVLSSCLRFGVLRAHLLGSVFGRTDFSRISIFGPPDFVADFVAGFFRLFFVGESAQKNPPGKSPTKSSKVYTTKIPDTFLRRGRANI